MDKTPRVIYGISNEKIICCKFSNYILMSSNEAGELQGNFELKAKDNVLLSRLQFFK